jgi:pimeloyl-ACP methyl ester carboxylesterase
MALAAGRDGLRFDYSVAGSGDDPAVLLVQGLGMPAAMWPDVFVETLVARGLRVVTFDNRDCGGSSRLEAAGVPNIPRAMSRALLDLPVSAPYTLTDMALDAMAVLDDAGIASAHVVGVSMGGMIAQVCAALQPQRVLTLTSVMSTTGNPSPGIALGKTRALRAILRRPPDAPTLEQTVDHLMFVFGVIGSPGFRQDAAQLRPHFERVARRGLYPAGTARQLAAILSSGDRRAMLHGIAAPTLVIHGADDPLVRVAGGRDTARHIAGARLEIVPGMGHDFPPALMARLALMIADHCDSARPAGEARAQPGSGARETPRSNPALSG